MDLRTVKALLEQVLRHSAQYSWDFGLNGRLSLTLIPGEVVVNVFDSRRAVPGCSFCHSHNVDFRSGIVAGIMRQYRYRKVLAGPDARPFKYVETDLNSTPIASGNCFLEEHPVEIYHAGGSYEIASDEIHRVDPEPGTVTLIDRQYKTSPAGIFAFWPASSPADQSAERSFFKATPEMIEHVVSLALTRWF